MQRFSISILLAALMALSAFAADVTGKWKSSFTGPNGTIENTITLKADGAKLTGSMESTRGKSDIMDGKVDGDKVSWVVVRNFNGNEVKMQYSGVVNGDEMKIKATFGEREIEMTAKRVN
ncbi:MAG: hypothetical protein HY820_01100 [Acidobacteria bacterium]|nr:hypothetical protein [Acidobacteriota bacterium]